MNSLHPSSNPAYLVSTGTAVPGAGLPQDRIRDFMISTMEADLPAETRGKKIAFLRSIYDKLGIDTRHSVMDDFRSPDPDSNNFFPPQRDLEPLPDTRERMQTYENQAPELAGRACRSALDAAGVPPSEVTHLIFTSCTGHVAPGPDVALMERLDLPDTVRRVQIGFMGCFAGLNTIRTAASIARGQPDAVVLQVCLELCTLHFQKDFSRSGIVSDGLFSDGSAAAVVTGEEAVQNGVTPVASIGPDHSVVHPEHTAEMTWRIGNHGFQMYLSPEIPDHLAPHLNSFLSSLLNGTDTSVDEVGGWAIHPGGRRILDLVRERAELSDRKMAPSRSVFRSYGNMSSPTVFFILDRLFENHPAGTPAVMMGFGPGLTMEGQLLLPAPSPRP